MRRDIASQQGTALCYYKPGGIFASLFELEYYVLEGWYDSSGKKYIEVSMVPRYGANVVTQTLSNGVTLYIEYLRAWDKDVSAATLYARVRKYK